ncbi:MAG: phage tail tape measure protein [Bacillota bacterium]
MASTTFTIALMLTAYNNMKSALSSAETSIKSLGTTFSHTQSRISSTTAQLERARKELDKWESRGMAQVAGGMVMAAPFVGAVKAAGDFQDVLQELKIVTYDAAMPLEEWEKQAKAMAEQAKQMGMATKFNATQAGQGYVTLAKGGVLARDILEGTGEATVKLAQASGMLPAQVAESMVKVGNAYSIQGKEMLALADFMSRVDNASTASLYSLTEGYKYASAAAAQLGVSYKDTGLALAVLNNRGLDGTTAGTNLADMLRRLAPVTRMSAQAMKELGLSTADVANIKRGASRIGLAGQDLFHDESGKLKPMADIIQTLRRQTQGLRADVVQVAFTEMFGVEGARAALALIKEGSGSWEEVNAATKRAMGLNERIALQQETFNAQVEQLQESWHTLMVTGGTPVLSFLTDAVVYAKDLVQKFSDFSKENPGLTRGLMYGIGAFAAFNIAVGVARVGFSIFGRNVLSVVGMISKLSSGALSAGRSMIGFWNTFQYFRQGAGIFRSLWSAVAFGHPALARVIAVVSRFGGTLARLGIQALVTGARLAAAWLVGLGPVGWIIMGVSAIIAAAVAAWKTNFGGFRDFVMSVVEKIIKVINKIRGFLGMSLIELDSVKRGVGDLRALEYEKPQVIKTVGMGDDNRQFNFSIRSTDPKEAAAEVSSILGGPGMDKYRRSRDPRLQYDFYGLAME